MTPLRTRLPSPSMLVACIALVISLGGVSYAAGVLPKSSVGTEQLRKKAVTAAKLRANAVTGAKVKDGSLLGADFRDGELPAGPQGPKGERGEQGPQGVPGSQGPKGDPGVTNVITRSGSGSAAGPGNFAAANATCATGETLVGGGFATTSTGSAQPAVHQSSPNGSNNGWFVFVRNTAPAGTAGSVTPHAYARCAMP